MLKVLDSGIYSREEEHGRDEGEKKRAEFSAKDFYCTFVCREELSLNSSECVLHFIFLFSNQKWLKKKRKRGGGGGKWSV